MTRTKTVLIGAGSFVGVVLSVFIGIAIYLRIYDANIEKQEAAKEAAERRAHENATWVPADAPSPQVYWAEGDTNSCANIEFDPRVWKAGVSKPLVGERDGTPTMLLRGFENSSWLSVTCEQNDKTYLKNVSGEKYFSPDRAFRHAMTDGYGKLMEDDFYRQFFSTKSGLSGVKVSRTTDKSYHVTYLIAVKSLVDDATLPLIVRVAAGAPKAAGGGIPYLIDDMVASLKITDKFPDMEPHSAEYVTDDVKQLYGTWDVGASNLDAPTAFRWKIEPFDRTHVLVTESDVQYRKSAKWYKFAANDKFNLRIEHDGIPGKMQVMLKGNYEDVKNTFHIDKSRVY